jgi:hypothetical protein
LWNFRQGVFGEVIVTRSAAERSEVVRGSGGANADPAAVASSWNSLTFLF